MVDTDGVAMDVVIDEIVAGGGRYHALRGDVSGGVGEGCGPRSRGAFRTVNILVNNASFALVVPVLTTCVSDWDRIFSVNVRSVYLMKSGGDPRDEASWRRSYRNHRLGSWSRRLPRVRGLLCLQGRNHQSHPMLALTMLRTVLP